ncbi:hypothetical protein D9757_015239 [Collybiopsis confluens]|uniref:Uncharacterized protein n=1 Tax=Collybiopsis confluens TaxID=2823264 RepID=A0A8H5CRR8_9AGAR|nr:hypothetical protein D9757_015239 [Collybiopsis confluens]
MSTTAEAVLRLLPRSVVQTEVHETGTFHSAAIPASDVTEAAGSSSDSATEDVAPNMGDDIEGQAMPASPRSTSSPRTTSAPSSTNSSVIATPAPTTSNVTKTPVPTNTAIVQVFEKNRPISAQVPAIVGSIVGALVLCAGVFLWIQLRRSRRARMFNKIAPLADIEENPAIQPRSEKQTAEPVSESESETVPFPRTQPQRLEIQHWHHSDRVNQENTRMGLGEDHDVRSQVAEMRAAMERMMEHVHRLDAQMGSGRAEGDSESIQSSSDEPPPTYVSL